MAIGLLVRGPLEIETLNLFVPFWVLVFACLIFSGRTSAAKRLPLVPLELKWLGCFLGVSFVWCCVIVMRAVEGDAFRVVAFTGGWVIVALALSLPQLTGVSPTGVRRMVRCLLLLSTFLAAAQIVVDHLRGYGAFASFLSASLFEWNKNDVAVMYEFGFAMCLGRTVLPGRGARSILALSVLGFGLFSSGNRGGLVGMIIALVALPFVGSSGHLRWLKRRRALAIQAGVVLLVGVTVAFVGLPEHIGSVVRRVTGKAFEEDKLDSAGRLVFTKTALLMIRDHWPTGVGTGQYLRHYPAYVRYVENPFGTARTQIYNRDRPPHNVYLRIFAEVGVLGLITFVGFCVSCVWKLLRFSRECPDAEITGVLLFSISLFIHGAFYEGLIYPYHWLPIGAALYLGRIRETSQTKSLGPARNAFIPKPSRRGLGTRRLLGERTHCETLDRGSV